MSLSMALTGSNGFLGAHLISLVRDGIVAPDKVFIGPLDGSPIPHSVLRGCDVLVHAAARAHILSETESDPLSVFRRANTAATIALARASIVAGVRRFVFISSIGVLGNHSQGRPLSYRDSYAPIEPNTISKSEAELALVEIASHSRMEVVILRPPLVHGPGVKGNFRRLMEGIHAGRWLPLGGIVNKRSFIGVGNLVDAIIMVAMAPLRGGSEGSCKIYHIADDGVISTRRLIEVLADGMCVKPRLLKFPRWLAVGGASMLGRGAMVRRLFDDLEVDDSEFRRDYNWSPLVPLEVGLRMMAEDFAGQKRTVDNAKY